MNHVTTGAGNDIERATDMARKMVCEWGMSDMGPMSFGKKEEQIFLGREISQHRDYSEATAIRIDEAVHRFVDEGYKRARAIIEEHRDAMIRIAEALLEREVLDGAEVLALIRGEALRADKSDDDKPAATPLAVRPEGGLRIPPLTEGPQPA
jgi:cell division protease FtsH